MSKPLPTDDGSSFEAALQRFDDENARDPNLLEVQGQSRPRELVYAKWLTDWVLKLCPTPSRELLLAARSQHLCRWQVRRDFYPMTRAGYLRWRADLKVFHAQKSGEILQELGFCDDVVARVRALNLKSNFPHDRETQVLEDALCLVFLEHQFAALASKTPEQKMISVLGKTWKKMTPAAHRYALALSYGPHEKALLDQVLG